MNTYKASRQQLRWKLASGITFDPILVYVITPIVDCHHAMVKGLECLDDLLSFIGWIIVLHSLRRGQVKYARLRIAQFFFFLWNPSKIY